ncbi:hypothetical protein [Bacillus sp. B1-b2]|uniref:hypothetical protein n=1 Tax=Bacillus sp. B1-b2 TaxID=2653201 RepID=UPI0012616F70|nr:hypothetical protein [Bacillus sp. B1-b2]KAB7671760.1 hypothetical protein F9279_05445 [Bacillus sp. B1-b2]
MKKILPTIIMMLVGMVFGAAIALVGVTREWNTYSLILAFICLIGFYIIHIIIHEAGHLLFGKITGYSLVSFRIFSHMWVVTENGLRYKKLYVPGTLGQCLMSPPPYVKGNYPFKLYLLGGVIMNFLSSLLLALFFLASGEFPLIALIFVLLGIMVGLTNLIPYGFNDGMSLKMAWNNENKQKQLYTQFYVNAETTKGVSYRDLPEELFELPPEDNRTDYFSVWIICMQLVRAMDRFDFVESKHIIDSLWKKKDQLIPLYKLEIAKERLFLLLLLEIDKEEAISIYEDKKLKKYLTIKQMSNKRILAAYEWYVNNDLVKAKNLCDEGLQLEKINPNKADAELERKLIDYILSQASKSA